MASFMSIEEIRGVCFARGKCRKALSYLNDYIHGFPEDAQAYYLRAGVHMILGELDSAVNDFQMALVKQPGNSEAMLFLGLCYKGRDQDFLGDEMISKALELNPDLEQTFDFLKDKNAFELAQFIMQYRAEFGLKL